MAKCAPKKAAKKLAIKDLAAKQNPKGGMNKPELIDAITGKAGLLKKA